jgi:hypothetical protein
VGNLWNGGQSAASTLDQSRAGTGTSRQGVHECQGPARLHTCWHIAQQSCSQESCGHAQPQAGRLQANLTHLLTASLCPARLVLQKVASAVRRRTQAGPSCS